MEADPSGMLKISQCHDFPGVPSRTRIQGLWILGSAKQGRFALLEITIY